MVRTTPGAHCCLLEGPEPGSGLAGIPDACPAAHCGSVHEATGESGHPRQVRQEVQCRALRGEDRRQRPGNHPDGVTRCHDGAVTGGEVHRHRRINRCERGMGTGRACHHSALTGHETRRGGHRRVNQRRGDVPEGGEVLSQGSGHGLGHGVDRRVDAGAQRRARSHTRGGVRGRHVLVGHYLSLPHRGWGPPPCASPGGDPPPGSRFACGPRGSPGGPWQQPPWPTPPPPGW